MQSYEHTFVMEYELPFDDWGDIYEYTVQQMYYMCYPLFEHQFDLIELLAEQRQTDELEWLLRLLVVSDPYSDETLCPITRSDEFHPDRYDRIVYFLLLVCADDASDSEDWYNATYELNAEDLIYLDDTP